MPTAHHVARRDPAPCPTQANRAAISIASAVFTLDWPRCHQPLENPLRLHSCLPAIGARFGVARERQYPHSRHVVPMMRIPTEGGQ